MALKWWLGVDTSPQFRCPHCPDHQLDPLGHDALTCRGGGDAVLRHNSLRDVVAQFCHRACLGGQLEVGGGTEADGSRSRPANYLVPNWSTGKRAAFDITVTSPLNPISLPEAKVTAGSAARMAEMRKHISNNPKCRALGWVCIPLAVETYGCWGTEARDSFSSPKPWSAFTNDSTSLWFAVQPGPYFHVSAPRPQRVKNFSLGLPHDFTLFMLLVLMCICNCNFIVIII